MHMALKLPLILLLALASAASADELTQNFDSWTGAVARSVYTNDEWVVYQGSVRSDYGYVSASNAAVLYYQTGVTNSHLRTPFLTNGIGNFSFSATNRTSTNIAFEVQTSADDTNWDVHATVTNAGTGWRAHSFSLDRYNTNLYVRIFKKPAIGVPSDQLIIDDVSVHDPPAKVTISPPTTIPADPLAYDPVRIRATITPTGGVVNLAATNYYRLPGDTWRPIGMTNVPGTYDYITTNAIPGQGGLVVVEYYINCVFGGPHAMSPTNYPAAGAGGPTSYLVGERLFTSGHEPMDIVGDMQTNMVLIADNSWQGVATNGVARPRIQFRGVDTNTLATNYWGDANQVSSNVPFAGTAELTSSGLSNIVINTTNIGQFVIRFNETNLAYSVRQCAYDDFAAGWAGADLSYGIYSNSDWFVFNATVKEDTARRLRGKACYLQSNSVAFLRSSYLPEGIGEVSFWHRNWNTNALPGTMCYIQRSSTGGTNASEWETIATVPTNAISASYNRYSVTLGDRSCRYVRLLNSTNPPNGGLCLDEVCFAWPGAGVEFANVTNTPAAPSATNTVTISGTILPKADASNRVATLYYRSGSTGTWYSIGMTNAGNTFTATNPIPPARGNGVDGVGIVQYYIRCAYEGFESEYSSPTFYPPSGSNAPTSYTIVPAYVVITNFSTVPDPPLVNSNIFIAATVLPYAAASNLAVTSSYRIGKSGVFTNLTMLSTGSNYYVTTGSLPVQGTPGTPIEYRMTVRFKGPAAVSPTNYPVGATNLVLVRMPPFASLYSNVTVTGTLNTNMILLDNYRRMGVVYAAGVTDPSFRFAGSNATATIWGDFNPAASNPLAYGTADIGGSLIPLSGTNGGYIALQFNETNQQYVIQRCAYVNFDNWTGAAAQFKTYTNSDGWVMNARTTASDETNRVFSPSGKSCVLPESGSPYTNVPYYVRTPELANGIGQISFLYRNWETDASRAGAFIVQISPTGTTDWQTVTNVTNILTIDYVRFSLTLADRVSRYVRIVDSTNVSHGALLLDEVVVTEPAAAVTFSGLTNNPFAPTITNRVLVSVNIDPWAGASNLAAAVWFRAGTSGGFDSRPMALASGNLYTGAIPPGAVGVMQYYVSCGFDGFGSEQSSPLYDPYGGYGAALPRGYTNTDVGTFQNFDTWSNAAARGTYTNENWILNEQGQVVSTVGSISPSNAAGLFRSATYTNTYLETPLIVSELGAMTLTFFAKGSRTDLEAAFQVLISTNGTDYEVYTNLTCAGTNWLFYTVILPDYPSYTLRIYISDISLSAGTLYLDNVEIAQPAAMVVASNLMVHPGYPATNDQVYVSCNVDTALQEIPAFNVRGTLWYKPPGSATNRSVAMTRSGNYLLSAAGIPESVWKSTNFYFVQVDFQGYYHTNQNRSPYFYPGTTTVISTNTAIPTNYVVRKFQSDFLEVDADTDAGSATLAQIEHYGWQGVLNVASPTSRLTFAYAGLGHYTGSGYSSGITNWGDSTAWKTNLPLYHAGGPNQSNLTVSGRFESQYLFRFNERTYDYSLQRCKWQDFDNWTTTNYQSSGNDNSVPLTQDFNSWPVNANSSRSEDFSYYKWAGIVTFTNKAFEEVWQGWGIYNSKITNFGYSSYYGCLTTPEDFGYGRGYTVWTPSEDAGTPLRGIGTVSFAYRPGTTNPVFDPVTVGLYLCNTNPPNLYEAPINWEGPYHYATGIASLAWSNITVNINTARTMTVIFAHKFGDTSVLFDNLYVSEWYAITTNVNGWIVSNGWITASGARSGNCCEFDSTRTVDGQSTNQYLRTPRLTNGVGVVDFWYRSATGGTVSLDLQIAPGGSPDNWTTVGSASTSSTNYAPFSAWIVTNADVYLRIRHTTPGYGRLLIDDVRLTQIPVADSWSADNAKMTLDTTREFIRNICILNSDATSEVGFPCNVTIYPNLKTPYLTNGIGEISFWYRNYNAGGTPAARFHVQKSVTGGTNAEEWVDIDVVSNVANTTYSYYRNSIYDASNHYVRIYNETNAPAARLCLDEVLVTDPLATDLRFSQVWPDPTVPLYTNSVHVYATLTDQFLNPSNIAMVTRFGTATNWGGWTTLSNITMTLDSSNLTARPPTYTWRTVTPIPAYTIDTYVVYYPVCTFNGYHTEGTSPKSNAPFATPSWYRPLEFGSSPPYYIVFSCPTGSVWINELNVRDATYDGNRPKYVELCGIAGANISNWYIEILSTSLATQAVYVIRNDWMLTDMTNGYGFWLLGDSMTSNRNMLLTNTLPTSGGGVRLRRSAHMYECAVAYGAPITTLTNAGFVNIGSDSGTRYAPLAAVGTGSTFVDFRWTNNPSESYSPGSINTGQTLTGGGQNEPPPYVEIRAFWIDTNVWIACTGTDTWFFAPWYSTNLIYTNLWTNVVTFTNTFLNGTNTLTFPRPTNAPAYYYKVVGTNTP